MADILTLRQRYNPNLGEPATYASRRTAFLISFDNRWEIENHPQTRRWSTDAHWMRYYRALKSLLAPVDVIGEDGNFDRYPFVIAPAYQLLTDDLVNRWKQYVRGGEHLIPTSRTGQKNTRGHLSEAPWAQPILTLISARILR